MTQAITLGNLVNCHPFTPKTQKTLSHYIFQGQQIEGGCADYKSLAERTTRLQDLQQKLVSGKLDLGLKDKTKAILICVATAIVVVAATVALIYAIKIYGPLLFQGPADAIGITMAGLGGLYMLAWMPFITSCIYAREVFKRPSPSELQHQLNETVQISDDKKQEMNQVIQNLTAKRDEIVIKSLNAANMGASLAKSRLDAEASTLTAALDEIQQLHKCFAT